MAVHLLLGHREDACCAGVLNLLQARNYPVRIIANPLAQPSRLVWRLDNAECASRLAWEAEPPIADNEIASVLVRSTGWFDPAGWEPADLAYMRAETQAALLAWLWSLACPVVNRYPPAIWYRPRVPLLSWHRLLWRCGLPTQEVLVTNVEREVRSFGQRLARQEVAGAVYAPLSSESRYLIRDDEDWRGVAALQHNVPLCLTDPHGAACFVCVVGNRVVWETDPSSEMIDFEPALRRFAVAAGLSAVELALAPARQGACVIAVEPYVNFEHFGERAKARIVDGIVDLLTAKTG